MSLDLCLAWLLLGQLIPGSDKPYGAPWPRELTAAERATIDPAVAARFVSLHVINNQGKTGEPIWGRYERQGERLVFVPRFALDPAAHYRLRWVDAAGETHFADVRVPALAPRQDPRVAQVYPTTDVVPANLLKFYVHFDQPIREGREIFDQITLRDERGTTIAAPWLLTELWNTDATRLTLRIHPGRVKRGVNLREQEGPVLTPGKVYTLHVSRAVRGGAGGHLAEEFTKRFRVIDEDHDLPRLDRWRVSAPKVDSREPLTIVFPEPLDPHLAERCITVHDPRGERIAGAISIDTQETRWRLTPQQAWSVGDYEIQVDEVLEDLAGNSPTRPFEVEANAPSVDLPKAIRFRPRDARP